LKKENERCSQTVKAVDHVIITTLRASIVANIEGTLKRTDIYLLRQIYSELYGITWLINDIHFISILAIMCWMPTGVLCSLYEVLVDFKMVGLAGVLYAITYSVLFFKVTFSITQLLTKQGLRGF